MEIALASAGDPPKGEDVAALASSLGAALPGDYLEFLDSQNGGYPTTEAMFPIYGLDGDGYGILHGLYGLKHPLETYDLEHAASMLAGRIPDWLLPLGFDPLDSQLCLAVRGSEYGQVFYWDWPDSENPCNPYFVAASFTAFLGSLRPP